MYNNKATRRVCRARTTLGTPKDYKRNLDAAGGGRPEEQKKTHDHFTGGGRPDQIANRGRWWGRKGTVQENLKNETTKKKVKMNPPAPRRRVPRKKKRSDSPPALWGRRPVRGGKWFGPSFQIGGWKE